MNYKTCISCGGALKFDRSLGFFKCTFCGKIHTIDGTDTPLSLPVVDEHMHAHRFNEAKTALARLIGLEPDNPLFVLRMILCRFGMTGTPALLHCARNNPDRLREIAECPDWENLNATSSDGKIGFSEAVKEYCSISLELIELEKKIGQNQSFLESRDKNSGTIGRYNKMIKEKETEIEAELQADLDKKKELEEKQQALLSTAKELEEEL